MDVSRFVAPSAMRNRRKVGGIGLYEDSIKRHFTNNFAQRFGVFKCDDTGEGKVKSQIKVLSSSIIIAREAVDHTADFASALIAQTLDGFPCSVSLMNHQRQSGFFRKANELCEHFALNLARRVVVIVV